MSVKQREMFVPILPVNRTAESLRVGADPIFKFGDPFTVSDIGRVGDDTLQWILDHLTQEPGTRPEYSKFMFAVEDIDSLPDHESSYVNEELAAVVEQAYESGVDYLVFRDM